MPSTYDNFGGISGGVFALFAFVVMSGMMERRLLPEGLALSMAGITLAPGIAAEALSVNAASVAHMAGGVTGIVMALVYALGRGWLAKSNVNLTECCPPVQERALVEHDEELAVGAFRALRPGHADGAATERLVGLWSGATLASIAREINPVIRGWIQYYGCHQISFICDIVELSILEKSRI